MTLNAIWYAVGVGYTLLFLGKYLRRSFDVLLDHPGQSLLAAVSGLATDYLLSWALTFILLLFNVARGLHGQQRRRSRAGRRKNGQRMFAVAVLLAPIVEEPLFRGLLYGQIPPAQPGGRLLRVPCCSSAFTTSGSTCCWTGATSSR